MHGLMDGRRNNNNNNNNNNNTNCYLYNHQSFVIERLYQEEELNCD